MQHEQSSSDRPTFDEEKLKEKERNKAQELAPNRKPTLATNTASHKSSTVSMVFEGNTTVPRAAPAVPAEADKSPAKEVPCAAGPEKPDASDTITTAASDKIVDALQKPVQPWRLLLACRKTEIERRTRPERPARTAVTNQVRCV